MSLGIIGRRMAFSTTPVSDFDVLNSQEEIADHVYYAKNSYKYGTSGQVVNGDPVGYIPAKKGGRDMTYNGNTNLAIINSPPIYTKLSDAESYITALNLPSQSFNSDEFSPRIALPREFGVVLRVTEGQSFEQFQNAFGTGDGFGDNGTINEIISGIQQPVAFYARVSNQHAVDDSYIPFYTKVFVQISYELTRTRLWVNGIYQGEAAASNIEKPVNGIFVDTNNADHQWFAQYHYFRLLGDSERYTIATSVMSKWGCGLAPQFPYAHNIQQGLSGGTWSPSFLTKNPSGNGVNLALTEYRWVINIRKTGGFEYQKVIATTETITNTFLLAQLEAYRVEIGASVSDDRFVYVAIKVFDNSGFGWDYFRGVNYTEV